MQRSLSANGAGAVLYDADSMAEKARRIELEEREFAEGSARLITQVWHAVLRALNKADSENLKILLTIKIFWKNFSWSNLLSVPITVENAEVYNLLIEELCVRGKRIIEKSEREIVSLLLLQVVKISHVKLVENLQRLGAFPDWPKDTESAMSWAIQQGDETSENFQAVFHLLAAKEAMLCNHVSAEQKRKIVPMRGGIAFRGRAPGGNLRSHENYFEWILLALKFNKKNLFTVLLAQENALAGFSWRALLKIPVTELNIEIYLQLIEQIRDEIKIFSDRQAAGTLLLQTVCLKIKIKASEKIRYAEGLMNHLFVLNVLPSLSDHAETAMSVAI